MDHLVAAVVNSNCPQASALPEVALQRIVCELQAIRAALERCAEVDAPRLSAVHPSRSASALNLLHYLALRRLDLRDLQDELARLGLSSLGRCEAHVRASVDAVLAAAAVCSGAAREPHSLAPVDFERGRALLDEHSDALFGPAPSGTGVRVMVTMPSEAADDAAIVAALVAEGMDCARINCAHDEAVVWERIIDNVRRAARDHGRSCRVLMDLSGPKLRTGPLAPGPAVLKLKPVRDALGRVVTPARAWLVDPRAPAAAPADGATMIPIEADWLGELRSGDTLEVEDARGAVRHWRVVTAGTGQCAIESDGTAYLAPGVPVRRVGAGRALSGRIGELPPTDSYLRLRCGDRLLLRRDLAHGSAAVADAMGMGGRMAEIGCTLPAALDSVAVGEPIWFDDGRIGGHIESLHEHGAIVRIAHAAPAGSKLRADKGINLPATQLSVPALTPKDLGDLAFVAKHADIVGLSFANCPGDVHALHEALRSHGAPDIGVVLKIETRRAFENVAELLLAAMSRRPTGVMIARGDLAVECGFERLAEVQEELLWLCEAAHMPVIWATQVLDTLAKTGRPSRAEITDAAASHRSDCVMLNKGPHVVEAVAALVNILGRMQGHQDKKTARLRALGVAARIPPVGFLPPPRA